MWKNKQYLLLQSHELWSVVFLMIIFYAGCFLFTPSDLLSPSLIITSLIVLVIGYMLTFPVNFFLLRPIRLLITGTERTDSPASIKLRVALYTLPRKRFFWVLQRIMTAGLSFLVFLVIRASLPPTMLIVLVLITLCAGFLGGLFVFFLTEVFLVQFHSMFHGAIEAKNIHFQRTRGIPLFCRLFIGTGSATGLTLFLLGGFSLWLTGVKYGQNALSDHYSGFIHFGIIIIISVLNSLFFTWYLGKNIMFPLSLLASRFDRAARGDLMTRSIVTSTDELGDLTFQFNNMMHELSGIFGKVRHVSDSVTLVSERLSSSSLAMSESVELQVTSTDTTASSMAQMQSSISEVADSINMLFNETEKTSMSIVEMASSIEQVALNIESLSQSVESTSASIEEMNASIKQVADNSTVLNRLALDLFRSTDDIIRSITEVEQWAIESSKLSNAVNVDADRGHHAVLQTVEGMEKIHKFFQLSGEVIQKLGDRSEQIGNILNVIDDVSSQTNLLALNAAIISAQAGEHGKEFSVVADEIRDLAEKATRSTKEIAVLIKGVQEESLKAVQTMEEGARLVAEGVKLSHHAGAALKTIIRSSSESVKMTTLIEEATIEQAGRSREISKTVDRLRQMSNQIAKATKEQKIGISQIMRESENMREMGYQVRNATEKQAGESRSISKAVSEVKEMVERIRIATSQQKSESLSILEAVDIFKNITLKNVDSMVEMDKAVDTLAAQVRSLENQVSQFQV